MTAPPVLDVLEELIDTVVEPAAADVDANGHVPARRRDGARARRACSGCSSSPDVGGTGRTLGDAAQVVRRLAAICGEHGDGGVHALLRDRRDRAARPRRRSAERSPPAATCRRWRSPRPDRAATSGRRSAPRRSTATSVVLDASKSWVTSAGEADSYVWTSRPATAATGASLWLVPADAAGREGRRRRSTGSACAATPRARCSPSTCALPRRRRLGDDGAGLDIALGVVLPVFQILNASCSLGLMDAAIAKAIGHVTTARFEHLDQTLADQPVIRQHVADDEEPGRCGDRRSSTTPIAALATGRADAPLRMLQSKAVAGDDRARRARHRRCASAAARRSARTSGSSATSATPGPSAVMAPTVDALQDFIGRAAVRHAAVRVTERDR